jgi:hypothetical protein
MPIGWTIFLIGIGSGIALGARGLLIPILVEVVWWVASGVIRGHFFEHSGAGDNVGAVLLVACLAGVVIGGIGVLVGGGLRMVGRKMSAR